MADLLEALQATRAGYDEECIWHRFLLDAYTGAGGFSGRVKPPAADYLGWAAEIYGNSSLVTRGTGQTRETYLDRFPREDQPKFDRRCDVAHYVNYVGPISDLLGSYLSSQQPTREGVEDNAELAAWMQDADGKGTSWEELKGTVITPRAIQLGWCPVLFDKDPPPADVAPPANRAQEQELKLRVRAVPLFPGHVLEWEVDDAGALVWVKLRLDYTEKPDPLKPAIKFTRIQIWTRTHVTVYRITDLGEGKKSAVIEVPQREHGFGAVPLVVFRATPAPDDAIRGVSAVGAVAVENRRHFNALSELDEHLRSTVFALLQVPIPPGTEAPSELLAGSGNAVPVPSDATQGYDFIAPPQSVADTYENRLKSISREIYRIASVPFDSESGAAQSGVSRAYQFEGTNKRLLKIATGMASAEQRGLQMAARELGIADAEVEKIRSTAPQDFRVDDLAVDIENLIKVVTIQGMSATAKMLLILRNLQKMLPNLKAEDRKTIEAELLKTRDVELAAPTTQPTDGDDATDGDDQPGDGDQDGAGADDGSQQDQAA